jgi:hypothetical protein
VNPEPTTPGEGDPGPGPRPGLVARARGRAAASLRRLGTSFAAGAAWLWARRPPRRRSAAVVFCLGAAAFGISGIVFQALLPARIPAALDWAALRALAERDARAGDAVALSPVWAERARELLPQSVPIVPGIGSAEDLPGVRRVWLVSIPEAPGFGWDAELALLDRARRSDPPQRLGAIEVRRYELAFPSLPLAFLPDRVGRAEASLGGVPCAARPDGFRCGGDPGVEVVRSVREVDGLPRPCLAVRLEAPLPAPLVVSFPGVPMGRTLRAHLGVAGRPPEPPVPVRLAIHVEGNEVGAAELGGPGFPALDVETTRAGGRFQSVALVLTSAGAPGDVCVDAVVLP